MVSRYQNFEWEYQNLCIIIFNPKALDHVLALWYTGNNSEAIYFAQTQGQKSRTSGYQNFEWDTKNLKRIPKF